MTHTLILKKPKITYRQFCLIQNSWMDLWTDENEEDVIKSMHPKTSSQLIKVITDESGKENITLLWTNKEKQ
jgi:hypothetical protein